MREEGHCNSAAPVCHPQGMGQGCTFVLKTDLGYLVWRSFIPSLSDLFQNRMIYLVCVGSV